MNNSTQWLRDAGVLAKLADNELNAPTPIPDPKLRIDMPISIEELGLAVVGYSVAMALAFFSFILELCTTKRQRRIETEQKRSFPKSLRVEEVSRKGKDLIYPMKHQNVPQMRSQPKQKTFQHQAIIPHI